MSDQNNNSLYENSEYPSRRQAPRQRRPRKKHRRTGTIALKVVGTLFLVGLCTSAILCCFAAWYIRTVILPQSDLSLDDFQLGENSIMYYLDRDTGEYKELVTLLNTTSSIWVDYEEIPENLVNAAVAIEDKRFWTHDGVDWLRTGRAVLSMFTGGEIQGGSTITQQLIKNLTQYNETTVKRKIIEIVRALKVDAEYDKVDIMELYLNVIPLGSGCEGVGSAAYEYFGKSVSDLTLAECASLIAITNNPSKYGPYSSAQSNGPDGELWDARQWNKYRQEVILYQMLDQEMISQEEYDQAAAQELVFVGSTAGSGTDDSDIYSWYEETVIKDVRADLVASSGMSESYVNQLLENGGLRIYTCLDPDVQAVVEEIYTNRENLNYTSRDGQQMQSAITVIDNATGDIVAIAGQFGEKEGNLLSNYATDGYRQPGSSFKPLAVYAPALEKGLVSPITVLDDYPYNDSNGTGWPQNSGTSHYRGRVTVREALTRSLNTVSVRILADLVTPQQSFSFVEEHFKIDLADAVEVNGQIKSDIDISPLAMGGLTNGVTTRQMAQAYSTFPSGGVYTEARTYTKVTQLRDGQEVVLLENEQDQEVVLKEQTAYYINSMLTNVLDSGTGRGYDISGMTAAGKTGTTSDNFDRWFVGYTPYYTAAVWTGYAQNARMSTSGNPAASLWQKVMSGVHSGLENQSFPTPAGLSEVNYCLDSGLLATEYCQLDPRGNRVGTDRVFQEDFPQSKYCTVHTEESLVTVCLDCPILNDDGSETGLYHIAGPYCPEESLQQICLPDYEREQVGTAVADDNLYRKSVVESYGTCTVHTQAPVEPEVPVDPNNPTDPADPEDPNSPDSSNPGGETDPDDSMSQDIPKDDAEQ